MAENTQQKESKELSLSELKECTPMLQEAYSKKSLLSLMVNQAKFYARSTIVPKEYQNNESNCFIAIEMSNRMGANPFQIMQSLNIIQGRPAWSSQFIISAINTCGRFKTPLNYRITGSWKDKNLRCIAYATAKDGTVCESIPVTYEMAEAEGWIAKNGSKWKTMPELMARYRSASFFGKQYCPEILMGLQSAEEQSEIIELDDNQYNVKDTNQTKEIVQENMGKKEIDVSFEENIPTNNDSDKLHPIADENGIVDVKTKVGTQTPLFNYDND